MSMNTYPVNEPCGFLITPDVAAMIMLKKAKDAGELEPYVEEFLDGFSIFESVRTGLLSASVMDEYSDPQLVFDEFSDKFGMNVLPEFEGTIKTLFEDKASQHLYETYGDEHVFYIPANKAPSLFEAAYKDPEEICQEFKDKLGEYLPEEFEYWPNIVEITGTYYC